MLVIVNPYATTMSDRLKHLVVYALQGRYDVTAVETSARATRSTSCRRRRGDAYDVVVAFGGDGTVNEAANGLAGLDTPLAILPGGSNNVFAKMLGIPNDLVDATEHLLAMPDHWAPRRVDLGPRQRPRVHLRRRHGAGRERRRGGRRPPRAEVALRRLVLRREGGRDVPAPLRRAPAAADRRGRRRRADRRRQRLLPEREPYTYFKDRPINLIDGAELDSGDLAGVVLTRANPVDVPTVLVRALSDGAIPGHRRVAAFTGASDVVVRSADGRPVPWHVDGDHVADDEEVRVSAQPGALPSSP